MPRIFFLRHGNTFEDGEPSRQVGAKTDLPLTEKGRAQARVAAAWLKAHGIAPAVVYSGRLRRQTETADIVASAFGVPRTETEDLVELAYGTWENLTTEELKARFPESYEAWGKEGKWPAEFEGSYEDARRHLSRFLDAVRGAHRDGTAVVAVTSQGVMKLLTSIIDPERWAALQAKKEIDQLKVKTGAICEISFEQGAWKTVAWNVVPEYHSA